MRLFKKKSLWIIIATSLMILSGTLLTYWGNSKQAVSYDMELLQSDLDNKLQLKETVTDEAITDTSVIKQDIRIDIPKDSGVTAGSKYNEVLVAENSKNILILGEDKGNKLYDTIGVVSIDSVSKKVSIIMLPRDLYIDYSKSVNDSLSEAGLLNSPGIFKLNNSHYIGAMIGYNGKFKENSISFLAEVIKEKFGIDVDEYVKVNTDGFKQTVDLFGGVDMNIPYDMNYDDPTQELFIHIAKGEQHLDGEQAEGFVRFRQGYKADGTKFDVDRKKNQLTFLKTFIKQHGNVTNVNKIPGLLKTLDKNIKHSLDFGDVLFTYMGLAKNIINDKYAIEDKNLNGEERIISGVSYVIMN